MVNLPCGSLQVPDEKSKGTDWWSFLPLMGEVVWCQLSKRSSGASNTLCKSPEHHYIKFISVSKFYYHSVTKF